MRVLITHKLISNKKLENKSVMKSILIFSMIFSFLSCNFYPVKKESKNIKIEKDLEFKKEKVFLDSILISISKDIENEIGYVGKIEHQDSNYYFAATDVNNCMRKINAKQHFFYPFSTLSNIRLNSQSKEDAFYILEIVHYNKKSKADSVFNFTDSLLSKLKAPFVTYHCMKYSKEPIIYCAQKNNYVLFIHDWHAYNEKHEKIVKELFFEKTKLLLE